MTAAKADWSAHLARAEDGRRRCSWCGSDPEYVRYHDQEWGRPVADDRRLYEKLCLEGFQSGLSWRTILRKRDNFRRAFRDFDFERVARFGARDVTRLLADAGIVRHRGKIESTINNARRARELVAECGSLRAFLDDYHEHGPSERCFAGIRARTENSQALSKELKRRGWSFVGPTTAYAFLQSVGYVNDHFPGCWLRAEVGREQRAAR